MSSRVGIVENVKTNTPKTVGEIVNLVKHLQQVKDSVTVTLSGYSVEVVEEVAKHYGTNFYSPEEMSKVDLNPYTIIYIDDTGSVRSNLIDCKSKIILYGRRSVSNHQ